MAMRRDTAAVAIVRGRGITYHAQHSAIIRQAQAIAVAGAQPVCGEADLSVR